MTTTVLLHRSAWQQALLPICTAPSQPCDKYCAGCGTSRSPAATLVSHPTEIVETGVRRRTAALTSWQCSKPNAKSVQDLKAAWLRSVSRQPAMPRPSQRSAEVSAGQRSTQVVACGVAVSVAVMAASVARLLKAGRQQPQMQMPGALTVRLSENASLSSQTATQHRCWLRHRQEGETQVCNPRHMGLSTVCSDGCHNGSVSPMQCKQFGEAPQVVLDEHSSAIAQTSRVPGEPAALWHWRTQVSLRTELNMATSDSGRARLILDL